MAAGTERPPPAAAYCASTYPHTHILTSPLSLAYLLLFARAADIYPEWLREQARRRHSNLAAGSAAIAAPRCYFLPDNRER